MGTRNHEAVLDWSQNMYTVIDYFVLSLNTTKKQNAYNVSIYYVFSSWPFERCLLEGRKGVIVSFIVNNQII